MGIQTYERRFRFCIAMVILLTPLWAPAVADGEDVTAPASGPTGTTTRSTPPTTRATVELPDDFWNGREVQALTVNVKLETPEGSKAHALLVAADADGRHLFRRAFAVPDAGMHDGRLPLHLWAWSESVVGSWTEVRQILLLASSDVTAASLQDVRAVSAAENDHTPTQWLLTTAFGGDVRRVHQADDLLIGTNAMDELDDADLRRIHGTLGRARAAVHRLFAGAVRPIDQNRPPALLIFREKQGMQQFTIRFGRELAARLGIPDSGGVTVFDIATSFYDDEFGADRPVYLHEGIHTFLAHDLRLNNSSGRQRWLHEGFATYVQMCVYPHTLNGSYDEPFKQGIGENTLFVPLRKIFQTHGTMRNYPQFASVIGFLAEERPKYLPVIARTLADGGSVDEALAALNTDVDALERDWLAWGRKTYVQSTRPTPFDALQEWTTPARAGTPSSPGRR